MQTRRGPGVVPSGGIFTGENMSTMSDEIDFRMRRLEIEASQERLVGPREGMRSHVERVGHAVGALGHGLHLRPWHPGFHLHRP